MTDMPRSIPSELLSKIQESTTSLCCCVVLTLASGEVFRYSSAIRSIVVGGHSYEPSSAILPTAARIQAGSSIDNVDISAAIATSFSAPQLQAGILSGAAIDIFIVDQLEPELGEIPIINGYVGQLSYDQTQFTVSVLGLLARLSQFTGSVVKQTCNCRRLGDARCGVDIDGLTETGFSVKCSGTVSGVISAARFSASLAPPEAYPANHFAEGIIEWTSGDLTGTESEIKLSTANGAEIELQLIPSAPIATGWSFHLVAGCDGKRETCRDKFGNILNFRGFPDLPLNDALLQIIR